MKLNRDVVISNCVINLCPDKDAVYKEAYRILRPDGRLAISDVILTEAIDPQLRSRFQSTWSGCLGGAIPEEDYWQVLKTADFVKIQIVSRSLRLPHYFIHDNIVAMNEIMSLIKIRLGKIT